MSRSVDTKYSTTPEDKVFGIDPFQAIASTTLNNIVSKSGGFGDGIKNLMGAAGGVATNAAFISFVSTGKLDKKYILDKLGSTLKMDTSFLANTPIANAGKLLQQAGLVDERTANLLTGKDSSMSLIDVYKTVHDGYRVTKQNIDNIGNNIQNNFKAIINHEMFDSYSSFVKNLESLNPAIYNTLNTLGIGEEFLIMRDIVMTSANLGVGYLIEDLLKDIKDEKIKHAVIASTLPELANSFNMDLVVNALDILGGAEVKSIYPNITKDVMANFVENSEDLGLPLTERAAKLETLLARIDINWMYLDKTNIIDMSLFTGMSRTSKELLIYSTNIDVQNFTVLNDCVRNDDYNIVAKRYYKHF